jgi:hypothetical protein
MSLKSFSIEVSWTMMVVNIVSFPMKECCKPSHNLQFYWLWIDVFEFLMRKCIFRDSSSLALGIEFNLFLLCEEWWGKMDAFVK